MTAEHFKSVIMEWEVNFMPYKSRLLSAIVAFFAMSE